MSKPVAKKKRREQISTLMSPKAQRTLERKADNHLIDLEEKATERYEWALALKEIQDEDTQVAINRMVAVMARMAGPPVFMYEGVAILGNEQRLEKVQYYNHLWIAMRLFIACAEWGIRLGNFKAPPKQCARCGKKVK